MSSHTELPANSGIMQYLIFLTACQSCYNLYIIDRWGGQIWSTHNFENQWDGTNAAGEPVPVGVYVYKVSTTDYLLRPLNFTGTISLVR